MSRPTAPAIDMDLLRAAIAHGALLDVDDLTDARLDGAVDTFLQQWGPTTAFGDE